ncbi:MAG TPA: SusC/RagA family TonB-linked outer membrane protein [Puia sp.]|nr:SusC/RagA family TonB-linked outer membrane protein [Puia sp.]
MKLTTALLIIGCLHVAASGFSQDTKVTLNLKEVSIPHLFKAIEKKTTYRFVYSNDILPQTFLVTISVKEVPVSDVLKSALENTALKFDLIDDEVIVVSKAVSGKAVTTITGRVTDEAGYPLTGVSVYVKGSSSIGTVTNEKGFFRLETPQDATVLMFSSIGMETLEIPIRGKTEINVSLRKSISQQQEIVVIGYGTQKKGDVTGSVATVKSENFIKGSVTDAGQLIQGKIAGLAVISPNGDPTGSTQILLRGQTTLMGANQNPLVLIDGIPGDMRTVATQDIESIDVLKDGSAAAIYGTRGTNGVILITTKRAGANNRSSVEYSSYVGTQRIARKLNLSTAADFRAQMAAGFRKTEMPDYGKSTDWLKQISQKPLIQSHNLTFRGGNSTTNALVNLNYNNVQGIFRKSYNQVFSGRADFNHSMFNNKLKINLNLFSSSRKFNGFNTNIYRQAVMQNPTAPVKNPDGTWFQELTKFDYENPVSDLMESDGQSTEANTRYKGAVVYTPLPGLKLMGVFSYGKLTSDTGYAETKQHVSTLRDGKNGYARISGQQSIDRLAELTAEYSKSIDKHNFMILGGYSYQENDFNNRYMENWDFPTDRFGWNDIGLGRAISSGDYQGLIRSYRSATNLIGFFGRVTYNYDQRYLLMASVRREEASQLWGVKAPWGTFPAISAGWRISKESFMSSQKLFNDLKIRAGYGVTGSQPTDLFRGVAVIGYGGFVLSNGNWIQTLTPTQNANPDLKWEEKRETNVGLDFSMLDNRVSGSIDYYNRQIHNLLFLYDVPSPPNLFNQTLANVGTMENKGLEVMLNFVPVRTKDFEWNTSVSYSTNKNKLVSLSNDIYKTSTNYLQVGAIFPPIQTFSHLLRVGGPVGDFYGFKVTDIGSDAADAANYGQWVYEGSDGKPVPYSNFTHSFGDKRVIGNGLPKFYAGWNNNFRYKKWDLSITQRGAFKFQVANLQRMMLENPTQIQYNVLTTAFDKVYGKTQLKSPLEFNSYYIENGDYWKIDNITLGYSLPQTGIKYIQSARFYVSVLNAFILTGYKGIDPEVSLRNGTSYAQSGVAQTPTAGLDPGVDGPWKYPTTRTFSLGLNVTF